MCMEHEQFKRITLPLRGKLMSCAEHILNNKEDAEDVVQETYYKLWFMRDELSQVQSVSALSLTMAKNLSLNMLKRRNREDYDLEDVFVSEEYSPYRITEQNDEAALLHRLIDRLPEMQRNILIMKHIEGIEIEEIASIAGCSPEAVRMNLSRARKKLRDWYLMVSK